VLTVRGEGYRLSDTAGNRRRAPSEPSSPLAADKA